MHPIYPLCICHCIVMHPLPLALPNLISRLHPCEVSELSLCWNQLSIKGKKSFKKVGMAVCGSKKVQQQETELQSSNPLPITNITKL